MLSWIEFEKENYSEDFEGITNMLGELEGRIPQQVKKRKRLNDEDDEENALVEYYDLVFPDDQQSTGGMSKLLSMARKWKQEQNS